MKNNIETVTIPKSEYDNLCNHVTELTSKVEWLMEQFRLAKHCRFGVSSEKSVQGEHEQMNFFNESEIASDILVPETELIEIEKHFRKRKNMVNDSNLPDDLPVEIVEHDLDKDEQICPECDGDLHVMGRENVFCSCPPKIR